MLETSDKLAEAPGIAHGFFGRAGGVSNGLYASLNCGAGSADDRAAVAENRRRALERLGLDPPRLVTVYQVHGRAVHVATTGPAAGDRPRADAMVSDRPGLALGILTADCAPVLLADPVARVIGAAHAGWQGALGGVIEAVVAAMAALGAEPGRIAAAIGPAIGRDSYEIGPEFQRRFLDHDAANARFFRAGRRADHPHFDLPAYVARRLRDAGVATIDPLDRDTCGQDGRYFSYRRSRLRDEADYGRQLSAIVLDR